MNHAARTLVVFAVLFTAIARGDAPPAARPSTEDAQVANLKDAKFNPVTIPGVPPGAMSSLIAGDPKTGASVGYAKFPPGFSFPTHWHSQTEYTTVISGKPRFTVDGKPYDLAPGSYIVIAAKAKHSLTCGPDAECVVVTRRAGAVDYNFEK